MKEPRGECKPQDRDTTSQEFPCAHSGVVSPDNEDFIHGRRTNSHDSKSKDSIEILRSGEVPGGSQASFHKTFSTNSSSKHQDIATPNPASQRHPGLPVDTGWAWMVIIGTFVITFALMTFTRAWALLFLKFLTKYQASATMTTLAQGLSTGLFVLSNLLQPVVFLPRFSVRTVVLVGASVHALSIIVIAYAPNIFTLILAFAVNGFALGFLVVPPLTLTSQYFEKRLSLAVAIGSFGSSVATITGPPFTQVLLDYFGLSGAVLLLAGLNLQAIPAALLLRPTSFYSASTAKLSSSRRKGSKSVNGEKQRTLIELRTANDLEEHDSARHSENNECHLLGMGPEKTCEECSATNETRKDPSDSQHAMGSTWSLHSEARVKSLRVRLLSSKFLHPWVILLVLASGFGCHTSSLFAYIPALGLENGVREPMTPILLAVTGSCELLSKILIGFFADLRLVQPITLACASTLILGLTVQLVPLYQGFGLMAMMQALIGLTTEVCYVLLPVLTMDLLGQQYIGHVLSGFFLIHGGITTLDHIVTGIIKDTTASFYGAYHYMGALVLLGDALFIVAALLVRRKTLKQSKDTKSLHIDVQVEPLKGESN